MRTEKKQTTIYILKEIHAFCKEHKVNLSEWLNTEFSKQYLSLQSKQRQLEALQEEISEITERIDATRKSLTVREYRYICQVLSRVREGKDMTAMWRFFNNTYGRNFSHSEFEQLVKLHEEQVQVRFEKVIKGRRKV